jgi:flagellar biosynthesis protein FlhB
MAEGSDQEKTEPASPRRLEQAREEGDIPRSREIATCTVLLAAGVGLLFTGEGLAHQMGRMLASGMSFDRHELFDFDLLLMRLGKDLVNVLIAFAPLAGLMLIVTVASPILIGGWLFSGKALMPNFGRLNPINGLGNMISARAGVELIKAILKAILVGAVSWMVVSSQIEQMLALSVEPFNSGSAHLGKLLLTGFITIVCSLVVIALIDGPYQLWHYANKLKMTREELRQEAKESDGDPHIKAKIRLPTWWSPTRLTTQWRSSTPTARCARRKSWPRARMTSPPRFVNSPRRTMCRCWKRRRWHARFIRIPSWAMKFRRGSIPPLRKCWLMYSSCVPTASMAGSVRTSLPSLTCRRSSTRTILLHKSQAITGRCNE